MSDNRTLPKALSALAMVVADRAAGGALLTTRVYVVCRAHCCR